MISRDRAREAQRHLVWEANEHLMRLQTDLTGIDALRYGKTSGICSVKSHNYLVTATCAVRVAKLSLRSTQRLIYETLYAQGYARGLPTAD